MLKSLIDKFSGALSLIAVDFILLYSLSFCLFRSLQSDLPRELPYRGSRYIDILLRSCNYDHTRFQSKLILAWIKKIVYLFRRNFKKFDLFKLRKKSGCWCSCVSKKVINFVYVELSYVPHKKNESRRESRRESCIGSDPRLSARLLARIFAPKSLGSDPMHDSLRDSFFYAG